MTDLTQETCYKCGVVFAMPSTLWKTCRRDKQSFWCPNGHSQAYTESDADRLRAQLQAQQQETEKVRKEAERERQWRLQAREDARHAERRLAAQKGVTTRMKNRVANGVCPCCNRTFVNLQRHMATKHAGFLTEEVQSQAGATIQ